MRFITVIIIFDWVGNLISNTDALVYTAYRETGDSCLMELPRGIRRSIIYYFSWKQNQAHYHDNKVICK